MIIHLVLAKLCGQLVRDHVTLERPVHKMHCNCELIPAQMILDDLFREGEELAERGSDMEVLTRFSDLSNQMSDQIKDEKIDSSFEIVQPALLIGLFYLLTNS